MNPKEGEFDRFAPENISAVVGWLASDLSAGVTGQVVKVMGGQVQLLRGWRPVTEATDDKPWTIDMIDARVDGDCSPTSDRGVPPFMPEHRRRVACRRMTTTVPIPTTDLAVDEIQLGDIEQWMRPDREGIFAKLRAEAPIIVPRRAGPAARAATSHRARASGRSPATPT